MMRRRHANRAALRGRRVIDDLRPTAHTAQIEADDRKDLPSVYRQIFATSWNVITFGNRRHDALAKRFAIMAERHAFPQIARVFRQFDEFIRQFHRIRNRQNGLLPRETLSAKHIRHGHQTDLVQREPFTANTCRQHRIVHHGLFRFLI